jgi:hypothetical protein
MDTKKEIWNDLNEKQDNVETKITGIRELFEEAGIMIFEPLIKIEKNELMEWRKNINKNGSLFFDFCKEFVK